MASAGCAVATPNGLSLAQLEALAATFPEGATMRDVFDRATPDGDDEPVAGRVGVSLEPGPATHLVSHAWACPFRVVLRALRLWQSDAAARSEGDHHHEARREASAAAAVFSLRLLHARPRDLASAGAGSWLSAPPALRHQVGTIGRTLLVVEGSLSPVACACWLRAPRPALPALAPGR